MSATSTVPATLGRFEIRGVLGAGAFGTVYRAFDPRLQREVALKVAHPGSLDDSLRAQRFLREARAAAKLSHPNIVPVFDAGVDQGQHYIAATFIAGRTLSEVIASDHPDFEQSARLIRALAEALDHAHRQGIIHRDVKPGNVRVEENGEPHLLDFGLAHLRESTEKLTHDGAVLGSPAYMSPEQAKGQQGKPQPAGDQYSLGVVLYELLTGKPPFMGSPSVVLANVLAREPEPPRRCNPAVPRDLETICLKAMAKRPEDRYPSCREMAGDLRRWLDGEPINARRLGLIEHAVRWVRREPVLAFSTLGAAAALIAVALVPLILSASLAVQNRRAVNAKETADALAAKARKQEQEAIQQTERAHAARQAVEEAKKQAETEKEKARQAEVQARKEEADTARALADLKERQRHWPRLQYAADLQFARYALDSHDIRHAHEILDAYGAGATAEKAKLADFTSRLLRAAPPFSPVTAKDKIASQPSLILRFTPDAKELLAVGLTEKGIVVVERRDFLLEPRMEYLDKVANRE